MAQTQLLLIEEILTTLNPKAQHPGHLPCEDLLLSAKTLGLTPTTVSPEV